jgi:hypothetical protein
MPNTEEYNAAIKDYARHTPDELGVDFEALRNIHVELPVGEEAYWTVPRVQGEWRLPRDSPDLDHTNRLILMPMRHDSYDPNGYLAVVPQPIIMHERVVVALENYARQLFPYYPEENTLARREYGVPMLIGRFDVIVDKTGNIQICELDDACSLWPALPEINPIAETYITALEDQLDLPIYTAELFQYDSGAWAVPPVTQSQRKDYLYRNGMGRWDPAVVREEGAMWLRQAERRFTRDGGLSASNLRRLYLHNEDRWRGDIKDIPLFERRPEPPLGDVALSVRAYRDMPGFRGHMRKYGSRSITMAGERDSKFTQVLGGLGVLAVDLDTAINFGRMYQHDHPDELLVFSTERGARTEGTAIFSSKGTRLKGVSNALQTTRKFGLAGRRPIVIKPYKEPDTLAEAGVRFIGNGDADDAQPRVYTDRSTIRSVNHIGQSPGERVVVGMEDKFHMIFRTFVVYMPEIGQVVHVGGMWQATDGRIVHGGAHSVCGPLYADGRYGYIGVGGERYGALEQAETLVQKYGRVALAQQRQDLHGLSWLER